YRRSKTCLDRGSAIRSWREVVESVGRPALRGYPWMVLVFGVSRCGRGRGVKQRLSQCLFLGFYQITMKLAWDEPGICQSLSESRNNASMSGKGEPYTEQERFSHVKHGIVGTRYCKVVEPGVQ